ncbi:MAG: fibronectin type III domain-containing protein [Candidatus Omnitrophica bacterium]|nr:fibronectin type III domain-containing protein [Candidatus Omnitrophota bacterium]
MNWRKRGSVILLFTILISHVCFGAWAKRESVDLTISEQAILPMSGPTAVIGLNLQANTSAGWPQPWDILDSVYVSIINANPNHPIDPEDFRKVAIYRDTGTKGSFDPSDYEIGSVDPRQSGSLSFLIPINFPIPDSDDAQYGTQGPDLWVVIFTSENISGDMPGGYDYRNKFIVRVGWPLAGYEDTYQIICDSRVVDLVPMRSDTYDPSSLLEINGYPTISGQPFVFNKYLYGPLYLYRAYAQDHPLDGVATDIDDPFAVPELCGLCIPYRVLGFSLKGRSTYVTNDNEYLTRVTLIIEDSGIPGNFDPGMLASHLLSPYSNIAIYKDNGDGYFDPTTDTKLIPTNIIPGTPHMDIFSLSPSPEGNNRWKVTFELSDVLEKTADGKVDYFVVIATDPSHGWVTNRPWYGSDFKIYIDPEVTNDGIVAERPVGEGPHPYMYLSPTLIRKSDKVKDVRIVLDIKPNVFDGPIEADGVPIPIFYINMTDSWGPFASNEALQWIRVWFKGTGGFKPNHLMPLSDDEDSGVSLWLDSKTGGVIGLPDSRTISENDMLFSRHRLTIPDIFIPLDTSSLEWYNSDGTKWSPTNDDPANPNDDDKRYFVVLKPKSPILLYNDDYIEGNEYPGRQQNRGFDLFICIKPRGISVPETGYKSADKFERGIDYGMRVNAAIGLTKYNDRSSIINNDPWEDILFTNGFWARIFPDTNRDRIYEPIEAISFPATVPTFFTNLTYPGQSINKFTKTPIIGINLVAPPGKNISFDSMSLIIIDDNTPPTLDFSELVKPNSNPNDPDGGCGIALYKDTNRNGIFDPFDKRVWMTKLPYLLPRAADDPPGRFRVRMEFGDPPQGYENHTSVGFIPDNDAGINSGPDYFLVIQPNENMDPGDRFHILLWGSNLVGEITLNFTGDASGITYKRVRTYTLTNTTVTSTIFTDLTNLSQIIDATSDPVGVIGISAWDPTGTNQLQKIRIYFNPKENHFPDDISFPTIIAPLTGDITSGISIWRDTTNDDLFNWRNDSIIQNIRWSSWKSDYVDGFVDGDGTSTSGIGAKTEILNWQGKILSYFSWNDKVYWYDANNDGVWSLEDCLWLDSDPEDGIFIPQTDKIIVGEQPPSGTFGEKLHEGTFGFVYYDEDGNGVYTDGDDIYFVGRGRNCLGWYAEGVLPTGINLPTTNTGNEFYIAIRTSSDLLYEDSFSISLPSNSLNFSSGYSFANINLTTHTLTGNVNLALSDLIPSNNYVVPPTYDCPAIGINLKDGKRDGTDGQRYFKEIVVYITGNLNNLNPLNTDGSLSGIALYKESGISSGWDIEDTPINLKSISVAGNKVILTLPDNVYQIPNDDTVSNSGDDFYIILRTSENAQTGETLRIEIRNDLSVPVGLAGDRIKFDEGTSGEYLVGTNAIQIGQPIILNAPQIISATSQFVNGKWQIVLNWLDNSESPDEDGFEIQRRIGTTGTWQKIGQVGQDVTTYTDDNNGQGLTPDTTYYYRIRAYITTPSTFSAWSNIVSATTSAGVLLPPTNLTGYAEYVNNKWQIVLNWTDNSENPDEDGFEIERDEGSGWLVIGEVQQDITTYTDDNNGNGLIENKGYSYRVRGFRNIPSGKEYSDYSNQVNLTTTRPDKPTNILPQNDAQNVSITPTLQASDYSHPLNVPFASAQWQIRLDNGSYDNPVYDSGEAGPSTSIQIPSGKLSFGTEYFWHVRYKDSNGGWSDWSDETSFTTRTNNPPNKPSCQSPINGATGITLTPTLVGSNFSDPDGDSFSKAQWRIRQSGGTNYIWQAENSGTSITVPSGILSYLTEYYWQVRYSDQYNAWSEWSDEASFTTMAKPQNPPRTPENLYPVNGASNVELTPLLVATGFYDPDGDTMLNSHWRLWESTGLPSNPYWENSNAGPLTSIRVTTQLQEGKTYYWQVRYQDSDGMWSNWSNPTYFTTMTTTPPTQPPSEGEGGCFIASVCFGENSWQVKILKEFRDIVLLNSNLGKNFVKFYYNVSPSIAEYLRNHKFFLVITKFLLYLFIIFVILLMCKPLFYTIITGFFIQFVIKMFRKKIIRR